MAASLVRNENKHRNQGWRDGRGILSVQEKERNQAKSRKQRSKSMNPSSRLFFVIIVSPIDLQGGERKRGREPIKVMAAKNF